MNERERLPNRRGCVSCSIEYGGHVYRATGGRFADGRLAELFLNTGKLGTPLQENADNAGILVSLLLQNGVDPEVIRHSVTGLIAVALAKFAEGEQ